ncbi:SLAP domain-containing protein [Heliorestis acidaminivorans]|uniref:SLAP domain-containing protein n=1 Tax=Heliorestis acidaminivorans TaxID=553427 RepID=A0A6I0ETY6_9FIRM|nr:SLAP domain-containing protein [Heliorestis acidaminivorans]KAB2953654.1 SLAP domain-containing protein [Heliorestis acidaminivorans]
MQGEVTVTGSFLLNFDDEIQVGVVFHNNMKQPVILEQIPLILKDKEDRILAKQSFDLTALGKIPPGGKVMWELSFARENVSVEQVQQDDWAIAFDMEEVSTGRKDFELEGIPEDYPAERLAYLQNILLKMPLVKPGEIGFTPLQAQMEGEKLLVAVVIRNGSEKTLKIEQLPLVLFDAQEEEVARAQFQLQNFLVSPGKARMWTFVYPQEMIKKKKPDLSRWSLQVKSPTPTEV